MKAWILILVLFAVNCSAATYYIDFASGSDSYTPSQASSKSTPWKHHPYMTGSAVSGYNHVAGDRFIFKGGVTWDHTCFPLVMAKGGVSGNRDYYGVDQTWYTGTSWRRPTFDHEYVACTSHRIIMQVGYIQVDNIEMKRLLASNIDTAPSLLTTYSVAGNLVTNCYLHGWKTTTASDGAYGGVIVGTSNPPADFTLDRTEIENSENIGVQRSGLCVRDVAVIQNGSKIHDNSSGILFCLDFNGSYLYNITGDGFDKVYHYNGIYMDPVTMGAKQAFIRNSYLHDIAGGANMAYPNVRGGATVTMYNNVLYGVMSAQLAVEIDPMQFTGEGAGNFIAYNNTIYNYSGTSPVFHVVTRSTKLGTLQLYNNHVINASALTDATGSNTTSYLNGNNLLQSTATATLQGYILGNLFAPIGLTGSTVGKGIADTTTGNTKDILGASRTGAWDIGAYQFGGSLTIVPPSAATIIITAL